MKLTFDPIAALATAAGPAGLCVVRISGEGALHVGDALLPENVAPVSSRPAGTFFHTKILHPQTKALVDDAIVLVFRAPHSYTGEDSVEIQGHGGNVPARRLLEAALAAGARLAEPGEYTRRAFLNGRMDLTQAEAVADFIASKSDAAASIARSQLDGSLGVFMDKAYTTLLGISADVEHMLDFDESELPAAFLPSLQKRLSAVLADIQAKADTWNEGRVIAEGALVVISGKPNAGKSSLMNALLGERRAIVSAQPGTTRDAIEEGLCLNGVAVRLVDTAGLRESGDEIEAEGIARAKAFIAKADINLCLIDPMTENGEMPNTCSACRKTLTVLTKSDLWQKPFAREGAIAVSSKTGAGIAELKAAMVKALGLNLERYDQPLVSLRQEQELRTAGKAGSEALEALRGGAEKLVIAGLRLRAATEAVGRVLGRVYTSDLLDAVFSRFCVGK